MSIPKIIHQVWIGPKPAPITLMNTWKDKHPNFEYIYWNEEEFIKRNMTFKCQDKIDDIEQICGKADIIRLEILYKYGGIYIDADSICIEPLDDEILSKKCFASWEHEEIRKGLISNGTMGFPEKHPLVKTAINWIINNEVSQSKANLMAWQSVGPCLLTRMYNTNKFNDLHIFPSYTFLPVHLTGLEYNGHGKIYAFQAWGSTKESYDTMNSLQLPEQFIKPNRSVSILVSSYNTKIIYIQECLKSIKHQIGSFNIELVWINDGSNKLNTILLKNCLDNFIETTRFTNVVYFENETNKGIGYSLNLGVNMCSNEIIIKMDSDDIMFHDRIEKQLDYMEKNTDIQVCGGQIVMFKENIEKIVNNTNHKSISLNQFKENPLHWIVNHPTLCYRKTAILNVGNYDVNFNKMEDFELMLRFLKHYKYIHNMSDSLLYYRLHEQQITHNGFSEGREYWHSKRIELIKNLINS
jgi:GT2 family glycosyltransferase